MQNEILINRLEEIFKKYPDLNGYSVTFGENDFRIEKTEVEINLSTFLSDPILGPSVKTTIKESNIHGSGVFAIEKIQKGELLEEGRLIKLGLRYNLIIDSVLRDYLFRQVEDYHDEYGFPVYFGLGNLSLYNHQDFPNATYLIDFEKQIMRVYAIKNIEVDEEIFISYGRNYFKYRHLYPILNKEVRLRIHELDKEELDKQLSTLPIRLE